jgi:hypothetical protein
MPVKLRRSRWKLKPLESRKQNLHEFTIPHFLTMEFRHTDLFGGAISADLPATYIDASHIREIPDNQEVYLDKDGLTNIIVEIMNTAPGPNMEKVVEYHFHDLLEDEEPTILDNTSVSAPNIPDAPVQMLTAVIAPKSDLEGSSRLNNTFITMIDIRLVLKATDMLVQINMPMSKRPDEDAAKTAEMQQIAQEISSRILQSIRINDWALFA